ncbi:MAG: GNAT family N-acetyltransferase [Planctomycetota bacterium]
MGRGIESDRQTQPDDVLYRERPGDWAVHTPARRDYRNGNKIVLRAVPEGPESMARALERWREEFADVPEVDDLRIQWEVDADTVEREYSLLLDGSIEDAEFEVDCVMVLDELVHEEPPPRFHVREAEGPADWDGIAEIVLGDTDPAHAEFYEWQLASARRRTEASERVRWWVATDAERVVGSAGLVCTADHFRFQEVWTRLENRRQGVAAQLCRAITDDACHRDPERPVVIVAGRDEPPMRIYARLGFVTRSYLWTVSANVTR